MATATATPTLTPSPTPTPTVTGPTATPTTQPPDGLLSIFLKEGADGTAKVVVKGKGVNLAMPDISNLSSPVTVQLKNGFGGCWGAVFSFPPVVKSDAENFKDKSD